MERASLYRCDPSDKCTFHVIFTLSRKNVRWQQNCNSCCATHMEAEHNISLAVSAMSCECICLHNAPRSECNYGPLAKQARAFALLPISSAFARREHAPVCSLALANTETSLSLCEIYSAALHQRSQRHTHIADRRWR